MFCLSHPVANFGTVRPSRNDLSIRITRRRTLPCLARQMDALCNATTSQRAGGPLSGILARKPSIRSAFAVEGTRRGTGLTDLSGAKSGLRSSRPITNLSDCASCARLVSVQLATLNTSSLTSALTPKTLARAKSRTWTKSIVCRPSPKIFSAWPVSSPSIQRMGTSVFGHECPCGLHNLKYRNATYNSSSVRKHPSGSVSTF